MTFACLEEHISADNPIRFIDAFVETIDLKTLGFEVQTLKSEGRPSYSTKIFLKLYLYGYLNFTNMKRVNVRGIKQVNKHALMAALTYNLKKYLKSITKKTKAGVVVVSEFLKTTT